MPTSSQFLCKLANTWWSARERVVRDSLTAFRKRTCARNYEKTVRKNDSF